MAHLRVLKTDPDDYVCIQKLLIMHWEEKHTSFDLLQPSPTCRIWFTILLEQNTND